VRVGQDLNLTNGCCAGGGLPRQLSECFRGGVVKGLVGGEAAVGGDVGEDLVDEGEYVGVIDGVDLSSSFTSGGDDAGESEFAQVLAGGGDAHPGSLGKCSNVEFSLGGFQPSGGGSSCQVRLPGRDGPTDNLQDVGRFGTAEIGSTRSRMASLRPLRRPSRAGPGCSSGRRHPQILRAVGVRSGVVRMARPGFPTP